MALIKVNTDKSGASALELTAHYKMTIYWGWQSVKPLQSWAILASFCLGGPYLLTLFRFFTFLSYNSGGFAYFQMSGGAKALLALLGGSPLGHMSSGEVT